MTMKHKWQVALLAGALAMGTTWTGVSTARAQDAAQDAARDAQPSDAEQAAQQQRRRNRGQGGGQGFGGNNPARTVEQYQTLVNELNLSADQKSKLDAIFKESGEKAKTLATEVESLQGRERREKVMAFTGEMRDKVNGVLSDEQKQTLRKNMATRQAQQMTQRYRRATADLGLSEDQKTKVEAVLTDAEKKLTEAMAQAEPGSGQGGGRGRGGPFGEITQSTRDKINEILTPEQQEKLRETMRQGQGQGQGGRRRGQGQGQGGQQN
jgi:hypothetical protein